MTAQPAEDRRPLVIASSVRRRIIDELLSLGPGSEGGPRPGLSAAQIGERFGLHVTTARFHLDRLIEAGVVEGFSESRRTVGRPRKLYAARFDALPSGRADTHYRALSEILAELWERSRDGEDVDPARAGHTWALERELGIDPTPRATSAGQWLVKVERVAAVVSQWGHRCSITLLDGGESIELVLGQCPFAAVAHHQPELVRELHRGILTGVLARLGEPDVEVLVAAIDDDDACVGLLRTRTPLAYPVGARR